MKGGKKLSNIGTEKINSSQKRELIEKTIRKYSDFIFRTAFQNLKNRHDAEDILQEVSIALVKSNAPLNDDSYLRSWLVTVTLNKCRDLRRSQKRRDCVPLEDCLELEAEDTRAVMEELWLLPEKYRTVIYLHYYCGFKIYEIAQIIGKNPNTTASILRRSRNALRKIIEQGGSYG